MASLNATASLTSQKRPGDPLTAPSSRLHAPAVVTGSGSADTPLTPILRQRIASLERQNDLIREAWESERRHLEAGRNRAQELYRHEIAVMDLERSEWEADRASMQGQIGELKCKIDYIESRMASIFGHDASSAMSLRDGERSGPNTASDTAHTPAASRQGVHGPRGAAVSVTQAAAFQREPYQTHLETASDPAAETKTSRRPTQLEESPVMRPLTLEEPEKRCERRRRHEAATQRKAPGKDTLQMLAASEEHRLRLYAGHTPSHSLSNLPSDVGAGGRTITASSSGEATPLTAGAADGDASSRLGVESRESSIEQPYGRPTAGDEEYGTTADLAPYGDRDRPLQGPLHLRNLPAKDAEFFDLLDKKLVGVSTGESADALPAVLRMSEQAGPSAVHLMGHAEEYRARRRQIEGSSRASSLSEHDAALEVPLRLRATSNFGAPFGQMRASHPVAR